LRKEGLAHFPGDEVVTAVTSCRLGGADEFAFWAPHVKLPLLPATPCSQRRLTVPRLSGRRSRSGSSRLVGRLISYHRLACCEAATYVLSQPDEIPGTSSSAGASSSAMSLLSMSNSFVPSKKGEKTYRTRRCSYPRYSWLYRSRRALIKKTSSRLRNDSTSS